MYRYADTRQARLLRVWVEMIEARRFTGWLALVWVSSRYDTHIYQVYSGRKGPAYAEAAAYADAVRRGGVDDGPWPTGVNQTERATGG